MSDWGTAGLGMARAVGTRAAQHKCWARQEQLLNSALGHLRGLAKQHVRILVQGVSRPLYGCCRADRLSWMPLELQWGMCLTCSNDMCLYAGFVWLCPPRLPLSSSLVRTCFTLFSLPVDLIAPASAASRHLGTWPVAKQQRRAWRGGNLGILTARRPNLWVA